MLRFDLSVDLSDWNVPAGMSPDKAVSCVREALGAMVGAVWVSVEWCGGSPDSSDWIRVYEPGSSTSLHAGFAGAIKGLVQLTVRKALFTGPVLH